MILYNWNKGKNIKMKGKVMRRKVWSLELEANSFNDDTFVSEDYEEVLDYYAEHCDYNQEDVIALIIEEDGVCINTLNIISITEVI